jgi:hypothetical protein
MADADAKLNEPSAEAQMSQRETSEDNRRRARRARIDAEQEHGQQLLSRYGREQPRERYASVGHAGAKRRRS